MCKYAKFHHPRDPSVGLTDYEVRDLNDEINHLLREKNHWENQIIALGGANYKRGIRSMLDDSGREIPGTRGYKYFGRAKDLPGVKELLSRSVEQAEEAQEGRKAQKYRLFANQPSSYLGDDDEDDGVLLEEEQAREEEMWADAIHDIEERLCQESEATGVQQPSSQSFSGIPRSLPRRKAGNLKAVMQKAFTSHRPGMETGEAEADDEATGQRKRKMKVKDFTGDSSPADAPDSAGIQDAFKKSRTQANDEDDLLANILPALDASQLSTPYVPDRKETEAFILRERKRMLREEYSIGKSAASA